nr:TATA-binding protein-associated factor BTAF1 [Tanacetum cinerariifolium]
MHSSLIGETTREWLLEAEYKRSIYVSSSPFGLLSYWLTPLELFSKIFCLNRIGKFYIAQRGSGGCFLRAVCMLPSNFHVTVTALGAAAVVWKSELPAKLNPIILPLMALIKREREDALQTTAAEALAKLIYHCVLRKPGPNDKLVKNLCGLICLDPSETPQAGVLTSLEIIEEQDLLPFGNNSNKAKPKVYMVGSEDRSKVKGFICRRGSEFALKHLYNKFGSLLFEKLPKQWDCLIEVLKPIPPEDEGNVFQTIDAIKDPQVLINNIYVVRSIALLPLARGVPSPAGLSESLSKSTDDVEFLEQLVDNSHIDDYKVSTELNVTLRRIKKSVAKFLFCEGELIRLE